MHIVFRCKLYLWFWTLLYVLSWLSRRQSLYGHERPFLIRSALRTNWMWLGLFRSFARIRVLRIPGSRRSLRNPQRASSSWQFRCHSDIAQSAKSESETNAAVPAGALLGKLSSSMSSLRLEPKWRWMNYVWPLLFRWNMYLHIRLFVSGSRIVHCIAKYATYIFCSNRYDPTFYVPVWISRNRFLRTHDQSVSSGAFRAPTEGGLLKFA